MQQYQHSVSKRSQNFGKPLKKSVKRLKKAKASIVLLLLGIVLIFFGGINYYRIRILSFDKVPQAAVNPLRESDIPTEIIIPSINIDLPIKPGYIKDGVWQISENSATFLNSSAVPGGGGNTIIYGHNKKAIFGNLPFLSLGQKIIIKSKSGQIHNYIASQKYFVGPDRVDLLSPTNHEELTIYTCWGIFDSQRAIIKAVAHP